MKDSIKIGNFRTFMVRVFIIILLWNTAFGPSQIQAGENKSRPVSDSSRSNRNPQSVGQHEDSSSLLQDIQDDVRNMNVGDSTSGPISILDYAGSSTADGLMYLPEARVHYPFLVSLLSKSTGYFHHNAMIPNMFNPGANGAHDLAQLLIEKFAKGVTVVSMILGVPNHYVVLAIQSDGRIRTIDSLATGYEPLTKDQRTNLFTTLKAAQILKENGEAVAFTEMKEIYAGQQKDGSNCLIFATLNAFQIARKGTIEGYQEVTASLSSDRLNTYYDLTKIGDEAILEVPDYGPDRAYNNFMLSFRVKTQELIASALNLPKSAITPKNKQLPQHVAITSNVLSSSEQSGPSAKKTRSERKKSRRNSNSERGDLGQESVVNGTHRASPSMQADDTSDTNGFLDRSSRKIFLVSFHQCELKETMLTSCKLEPVHLVEHRNIPKAIPYQTSIQIERSASCKNANNIGNLSVEVSSSLGTLTSNFDLNYFKGTSQNITLPNSGLIEKMVIQPKSQKFYQSNKYSHDCEISILVELNTPIPKSKNDAISIMEVLNSELKKSQNQFDILTSIEAYRETQQQSEGFLKSLVSKITGARNKSPLMELNSNVFDIFINDTSGKYDDDAKDLFTHVAEIINRAKLQTVPKRNLEISELLTDTDIKSINTATKKLSSLVTKEKIEIAKTELLHKTIEYQNTVTTLEKYFDSDSEKTILERELLSLINEEINGEVGLVARIEAELYLQR